MRQQGLCLTEANKMQRMRLNNYFLLVLVGNVFNIKKIEVWWSMKYCTLALWCWNGWGWLQVQWKDKTEKQWLARDQHPRHRELKFKTNVFLLAEGISQVDFGKASCVNWVSYLYNLLETISFLLTESGGAEVPPHQPCSLMFQGLTLSTWPPNSWYHSKPKTVTSQKSLVLFRMPLQSAVEFWPVWFYPKQGLWLRKC